MSLKGLITVAFLICVFGRATTSANKVVAVNRNDIDSFLVKGGCSDDPNVCPRSATCHSKTGLCLCDSRKPTYQNPEIITDGEIGLRYGTTYGCVNNQFIDSIGSNFCPFNPFKKIPYIDNGPAVKFNYEDSKVVVKSCSFKKAWITFPGQNRKDELPWLNESFVDLKVSSKSLYFKWKKPVQDLQGTIITFNLRCDVGSSILELNCLKAKVFGRWLLEECSTGYWSSSFNVAGWSKCSSDKLFINKIYRRTSNGVDGISNLDQVSCCSLIKVSDEERGVCKTEDWSTSLNRNNQWSLCPLGYFLNGLNRTAGDKLSNIKEAFCCKPEGRPDEYELCYDEDVATSFNQAGWSGCLKAEGYYITGVYRGPGEDYLNNIDKFRCCQMVKDGVVSTVTPTTGPTVNDNPDSDGKSSNTQTTLIAVLVVALVIVVILAVVVGFLWKKIMQRNESNRGMQGAQVQAGGGRANEVETAYVDVQDSGGNPVIPPPTVDNEDYQVPTIYKALP
ncbi:uncharacterized protein LOC114530540 [Dendronephthya gigantea]|uniref:uncharacterized protein LOC114530540 n=1 Tax=Dendronephthya gigantea TaxID=151771 RepID=UPI00106CD5DD|nr:uncharacterized protein LOC114530540 [Dendronephthya gigantea]